LLLVYALTTCLHKHLLTIYTIEKWKHASVVSPWTPPCVQFVWWYDI
jgi:hypothetical protein